MAKAIFDANRLAKRYMMFTFNLKGLNQFRIKLWIMKMVLRIMSWLLNFDIRIEQ